MKKLTTIALSLLIFAACNQEKITTDKITVIDDIVLGKDKTIFFKQFDSLNIKHRVFFNQWLFDKNDDLSNPWHQFASYYTNTFNRNPHNTPAGNECIGLLCPVYLSGTEHYIELRVLLCNTITPSIILHQLPETYLSVNQNINENICNDITKMYITKYGTPTIIDSDYNSFYVIEKGNYFPYHDDDRKGILYVWGKKYLTIRLFTGLKSYDCSYDTKNKGYNYNLMPSKEFEKLGANDIQCYSFPFIDYQLTDTAIKELNLDKMKI